MVGLPGEIGPDGIEGERGLKGQMGSPGPRGINGLDGLPGIKGEQGDSAPPPPQAKGRGYIFTHHSQSVIVPECPPNTEQMWQGYSLASVIGAGRTVGQDLGSAGSCMLRFSTMPYMFCGASPNDVCSYAQNNDDVLWLATAEPMQMSMEPIPADGVQNYISRCSVCESRTKLIAIHSQTMDIPDCPPTWEASWVGYSYLMVSFHNYIIFFFFFIKFIHFINGKFIIQTTTDNTGGFGQDLISPGSCLKEFHAQPVIECHGQGRCNYYDQMASFWLAVIDEEQQFRRPKQQTLKSDPTSKVSR